MSDTRDTDRLLDLLALAGPVEWESLDEVFDAVRDAEILGPDDADEVWLVGRFPDGEAGEVSLGCSDEPIAAAALRWRRDRRPQLN
jgi:hypothetical protein